MIYWKEAMKIPIINPQPILLEKTWLGDNYTSGTSITVKNSTGFADDDLILVGEMGQERTEITALTATPPSVTTMTITAMDFPHSKDTPVAKIIFDTADIYESSDNSTFTLLASPTLNYEKPITVYDAQTGSASKYYKIKLRNSINGNVSDFSDVQMGSGWSRKSVGRMIRNVRRYLKDLEERVYQDWEIMQEFKNCADEIGSEIPNAYWRLKKQDRTTTASTNEYYLPTDYQAMLFLLYTYAPSATETKTYPLEYKPKSEFINATSDNTEDESDYLDYWTEAPGDSDYPNGYFRVYPTPETSGEDFELWYFKEEPDFDSYGDVTDCPLPSIYESYAVMNLSNDEKLIAQHEGKYTRGIRQLKYRQRRDFGPKSLRRWFGRDGVSNLYGRAASKTTDADKENYW